MRQRRKHRVKNSFVPADLVHPVHSVHAGDPARVSLSPSHFSYPSHLSRFFPAIIREAGEQANRRFLEFFTANIRNRNTRAAYARAVNQFFIWCEKRRLKLGEITPVAVAAYVEGRGGAKPTVKQHLAAIRMLFDWLVIGQVIPVNPATSVRGPKHVVKKGKTPVLDADEARMLLESIDTSTVVGLRDRALIGVMLYAFARVEAVVGMKAVDYYPQGKRWWFRLHEKGGKRHEMPAHHRAEEFMDAYLTAADISPERVKATPLFRAARGRTGTLTDNPMSRTDVWRMIKRRAKRAGIRAAIGCHTFRATGITNYMENGGTLEKAQAMAAHESPRTTKLYDRSSDVLTLDEVERIAI
jgi:site-specific recombinase XerD